MKCTKKNVSALLLAGLMAVPACLTGSACAADTATDAASPAVISPAPTNAAEAAIAYHLQLNGQKSDIEPQVMLPLRAVAEKLGWTVTWQPADRSVLVDTGDVHTTVALGQDLYIYTTSHEDMVGMSAPFSLGIAPTLTNGVTYVPASFFNTLDSSDSAVTLDGSTLSVRGQATDIAPQFLLPLRAVAEQLGWTVTWQAADRTTLVDTGEVHTTVALGQNRYFIITSHEDMVGMSAPFSLEIVPILRDSVTYVPLSLFDTFIFTENAVTVRGDTVSIRTASGDNAQMPNPFQDCASLPEAAATAGFSFQVPENIEGYPDRTIQAWQNEMIQVFYANGDRKVLLRKGTGTGDISGDYNAYAQVKTETVHGVPVTMKGNDGKIYCATWTTNGYAYAIDATDGLTEATVLSLLAAMQ